MLNNLILLRDELKDTGGSLYPQSYFWSPDVIVHDHMEDPIGFLSWSYLHDVSQPLPPQGGNVLVYVRTKNISTSEQTAYIHLYAITPDWFTKPKQWSAHKLKTESNADSVCLSEVSPGDYGITETPFLFPTEKSDSRMLLAIASDSAGDPVTGLPDFTDHADFAYWVRENPCVCMRIPETRSMEFMLGNKTVWNFRFFQPEQARKYTFRIDVSNAFPVGTSFVCTSPFFDKKVFNMEKGGISKEFEGIEVTPGKNGVIKVESSVTGEIQGEAIIRFTTGIKIGADFYPVGCSSVKCLKGKSGGSSNSILRPLNLCNEDDRYLLQQKFVTMEDLGKYPTLQKHWTDTLKAAANGVVTELPIGKDFTAENKMFSFTKEADGVVSYVSRIDLKETPVCSVVNMEAIDTSTGKQVGANVVMFKNLRCMEAAVDIPTSHNPAKVALYTTLISVNKDKQIQAVVAGELLEGNSVIEKYDIQDPSRKSKEKHDCINVSIENNSSCWQGQGKSDYTYNIKTHYNAHQSANQSMVPFFLPMKGNITFKETSSLYPTVPEVTLTVKGRDAKCEIQASYMDMAHDKCKWTFEGNKVSWEFLEDWGSYIPMDSIGCTNYLTMEAVFDFKTSTGDKRVTIASGDTSGLVGNFITIEYIDWCWGCLAEGTFVRMADGSKMAIEAIRPGDMLRGQSVPFVRVMDIFTSQVDMLVVIRTESGKELYLTPSHPVETKRGQVRVEELNAADLIRMEDGSLEYIDWLLMENAERRVFNLLLETPDRIFANGIVTGDKCEEKKSEPANADLEASVAVEEMRKLMQALSKKQ
ncbi:hypothetical protein [uncultured Bacteroides sp.]|uniref:Hint domain-containing protein n=1 Tax=uncultured Bacteroides sp. TaxID=162156 RepID=UPI0025DD1A9B|nr:hypothetical protein [uncultured Bacteroides sp.]